MQCPKSQLPRPARASGALSGRFLSYSRECSPGQRNRTAEEESPAPAAQRMHFSQGSDSNSDSDSNSGAKSKRRSGSKESAAQIEPEWLLLTSRMRIGEWLENGRPVRGARPSVRAQSRARLPAYSPLTRLLHSCTTWQWLASELCVQSTPLQYRRDSRAEVTAHRAGPAASGDP
jgi:hypothetical protein